jgi:hypothetical protein
MAPEFGVLGVRGVQVWRPWSRSSWPSPGCALRRADDKPLRPAGQVGAGRRDPGPAGRSASRRPSRPCSTTTSRCTRPTARPITIAAWPGWPRPRAWPMPGSRTLTWDPLREKVTIHDLAIVRDGKRIDVLQGGKDVLVLRREKNMERAMLDGRMSASIQIKDLQVGDLIDWSYTQERRDPRGRRRTNDFERMGWAWQDRPVSRAPVVGRGRAPGLEGLDRLPRAQDRQERQDQRTAGRCLGPVRTQAAGRRSGPFPTPGRAAGDHLSRLGRRLGPHGARCTPRARPWPGLADPRRGRRDRRRFGRSQGPGLRGLRLVEDKTRYLFLGMGDGGYKPAPADETWSRRFGDCKGKTVLLLALLRELKIEAEPVLCWPAPAALTGWTSACRPPPSSITCWCAPDRRQGLLAGRHPQRRQGWSGRPGAAALPLGPAGPRGRRRALSRSSAAADPGQSRTDPAPGRFGRPGQARRGHHDPAAARRRARPGAIDREHAQGRPGAQASSRACPAR